MTGGTNETGLELAVELVHDDTVVAGLVGGPGRFCRLKGGSTEEDEATDRVFLQLVQVLLLLDVRLIPDPVQVLVQPVQEVGQQLLRVLLVVATEPGGELADGRL